MGCSESKVLDSVESTATGGSSSGSSLKEKLTENLLNTDTVKTMSKNAFASVLNKYPESKKIFKVPETTPTDTPLADTKEVQAASDKLLSHYMDIVKTSDSNLESTVQKKATDLSKLGVKAEYIKTYGDNLATNTTKDTTTKLSSTEEKIWKSVTSEITSKLTAAMAKLPSSSS
ncbi:unnamed protein product [Adineta steineri]|uniref:Globin domain-containing protein n=1 Tax=Adineta steineri TaxID=433720 RepID=A0A814TW32_9BILA|nr:unnamed protein product [Adineta steineri]CAF1166724.1 unnamed protein product [Adineta steineri]CAF1213234.1 unnamed protein product [Adineta steineri]CAF1462738.1 unnamed protein product [Adineta steineri]CAF3926052.1 unnamed protein product [Adineta steineri]